MDLNVTSREAAACLRLLKAERRFVPAIEIARRIGLDGSHETLRRRVRAIVKELREAGEWIVGKNPDGCYWTEDRSLWTDYQEGRKIDARRILGEAHRRQRMATDAAGQGLLFVRQ